MQNKLSVNMKKNYEINGKNFKEYGEKHNENALIKKGKE